MSRSFLNPVVTPCTALATRARAEAMQRGVIVAIANGVKLRAFLLEGNPPRQIHAQFTFGPLHFDRIRAI